MNRRHETYIIRAVDCNGECVEQVWNNDFFGEDIRKFVRHHTDLSKPKEERNKMEIVLVSPEDVPSMNLRETMETLLSWMEKHKQ